MIEICSFTKIKKDRNKFMFNSVSHILFDLLIRGKIENQKLKKGDILIFASVGAGMNINAFVYRY